MKVDLKLLNETIKRASAYTVEGLRFNPALGMLHIKTDSTGFYATITAFRLSSLITITLPIEKTERDLDFMVAARALKNLLKVRKAGAITFDVVDGNLKVMGIGSEYSMETYKGRKTELPDFGSKITSFSMDGATLKKAFTGCKKISTYPILLRVHEGALTIQGTDGDSTLMYSSKLDQVTLDFTVACDLDGVQIDKGETEISVYSEWLSFSNGGISQFLVRQEQTVPAVTVRSSHPLSPGGGKEELQRQLDIATCYGMGTVWFSFSPGVLTVSGKCDAGSMYSDITVVSDAAANYFFGVSSKATKRAIGYFPKGEIILKIAYVGDDIKPVSCLAISQPGCDYIVVVAINPKQVTNLPQP